MEQSGSILHLLAYVQKSQPVHKINTCSSATTCSSSVPFYSLSPLLSAPIEPSKLMTPEIINSRAGGVYIPPFKLARLSQNLDKSSPEYQRQTWEALRKSLNGIINKVNVVNIGNIIPELFQENLVRGRGLFCRALMKAQLTSPGFTHVYAALIAIVNTKLPEVGELLLKRVVFQFRRAFRRNDKVETVEGSEA